ncbi:MAG: hypothetical protein ACJ0ON_01005 [Candidatus Marisimplicoccus sp.]
MKIGIVIINWNGLNLLKKYLKVIIENSDDSSFYIIDNNSSDDSIFYVTNTFKDVKIISLDKKLWFCRSL